MRRTSGLPFASLPGLGDEELPGFSAEECPEELPDLSRHFSLAAEVLKADRNLYEQMRSLKTSGGVGFAKCIKTGIDNRGHPMIKAVGAVAADAECYDTFQPFFDQLLAHCHGEEVLSMQHGFCPARSVSALEPVDVVSCHLRISRNLKDMPFVPHMQRADRTEVEQRIVSTLLGHGAYYPLAGSTSFKAKPYGMDASEEKMLLDDGLLFREPDSPAVLSTGGGRHWPEGRGVLLLQGSEGGNVWAWVNEEEHFKLHIDRKDGKLKQSLTEAMAVLKLLESTVGFAKTQRLGYLTSCPMNLGIAMVASYVLRVPNLMLAKKELVDWCKTRDVIARGVLDPQGLRVEGVLEISHRQKMGIRAEDMVAELSQEASLLCRAEALVVQEGLPVQEALDLVKPRELTPILGMEDEDAIAMDAWAFSGDQMGMLISNAMILEEVEAAKVKLGQTLMAGTLGSELTSRANAWQQEREEEFERQKAEAAIRIQAIQRGRQERVKAEQKAKAKQEQEPSPPAKEAIEARKAMLREALELALNDGTLEQVLMDCSPKDVRMTEKVTMEKASEQLRQQISAQLLSAAEDGRLEAVLAQQARKGEVVDEVIDVKKGMSVTNMRRQQSGHVLQFTATDVLVKYEDGKTEWTEIEDLKKLVVVKDEVVGEIIDVRKGMRVTNTRDEQTGQVMQYTATDVLVKYADGKMEWTEIEDLKKLVVPNSTGEELRKQLGAQLLAAADDGSLEAMLRDKAEAKAEDLRLEIGQQLLNAVEDGSLEKILQEKATSLAEQVRLRVGQQLVAAAGDGRLEAALLRQAPKMDRLESVRQQTAARLLAAAEDGRLDRALQHSDLEAARQRLAANFLASAEDGRLQRLLSAGNDLDALRQRVSQQLLAAAEDGRLEKAMQKRSEVAQDLVRGKAGISLLKAAEDGQLEELLIKGSLDDIRSRIAISMFEAAETDRLEEALRGSSKSQELRVATLVPWSDVVPDEIQNTDLIAQAHLAAQGQLKIGAPAAQSTLLRYERRIGTLVAQIHQAEKESLTKSAEAASLEVALQEAELELRRVDQDLESQKMLIGNEELRALQLQDRQRQLIDQLDQETLKAKHARIEWRGNPARELA